MWKDFLGNESGAVTVDWVVLTGALVGLGLATTAIVSAGVQDLSGDTRGTLESDSIIVASFGTEWPEFVLGYYERPMPGHNDANFNHLVGAIGGYNEDQLNLMMAEGLALYNGGGSAQDQAWGIDTYALAYDQMQARGMDVSGMTNPNELLAGFEAQHGAT
ncbi:hypothetical protein [Nioella ostreopsis]|uniref:hypothetical protein n=1 Tax=Nioella ostreopsis TaxID=2448479 RepID=UPI000FDCA50B|nr:hypothetical protein [Nioella ostreopsis]